MHWLMELDLHSITVLLVAYDLTDFMVSSISAVCAA
jgi:hypothetical protein